ncbi:hypothetical protein CKAH01_07640 [Colletotrichum kahawae]|uniref:Uncharacterized protein n=1 Tax=Colletotrichum kahawae TaxID=34407 RepID=A0AAE0D1A6_COLKA|nr:hypothetical protein CKAH01_07640 [Colletotrichum kahawae]
MRTWFRLARSLSLSSRRPEKRSDVSDRAWLFYLVGAAAATAARPRITDVRFQLDRFRDTRILTERDDRQTG